MNSNATSITVKVSQEFKERVEKECKQRGISEGELITIAVEHLLNTVELQK